MCKLIILYTNFFSFSNDDQTQFHIAFLSYSFSQLNYVSYPTWLGYSHVCTWGKLESNMSAKMWISLGMNQYVSPFSSRIKIEFHRGCIIFQGLTLKETRYIQLSSKMKFNHLNTYFVQSCVFAKKIKTIG